MRSANRKYGAKWFAGGLSCFRYGNNWPQLHSLQHKVVGC